MTRNAHSPSSEPKQIIILMFFRQTISILIKKAFSPPQSFNENQKIKIKRKRAKGDGKGKVTFTRQGTNFRLAEKFNGTLLSRGTVQYFRPVHTGLWTAKVVPYERNSQKHEFKISLRIVSCFLPLSPASLQRRRAQTAETSEKCWSKSCIPFVDIGR